METHRINVASILFSFLVLSFSSPSVSAVAGENPFSAKAYTIRYWNSHVSNNLPKPQFLLSKASPLSAVDSAFLSKLASQNALSSNLESFCSLANLFCFFDSEAEPSLARRRGATGANFALYSNKQFNNYGSSQHGGADTFKNYSNGLNNPSHSFKTYSRASNSHQETFANYARDGNVANGNFSSYGASATGGSGGFTNYDQSVNVPNLQFSSYDSGSNAHKLSFSAYSGDTNTGLQSFTSYAKNGKSAPQEFTTYGESSNIVASTFTGYSELAGAGNDSFKSYGGSSNNPHNNFKAYGSGGKSGVDMFSSYRDGGNVGDDSFQSYAKNSISGKASFNNYGRTFNRGNDTFKEYGKGATGRLSVGFSNYNMDRSFKEYAKNGVAFSQYFNSTSTDEAEAIKTITVENNGISVNKWVEPGKFFREAMLTEGNVMPMPDIKDKMPPRSFLPRSVLSKLPFSTTSLPELKRIFHAPDNSAMEHVIADALAECERSPSRGETKRCVGSIEDMIDFATSVLGNNVVVRSTENVEGSKREVMIGTVKGINGGRVTKSVSCHQSLYPHLVYYCHSVPKVRVYEAEILDAESKVKINHGVAICHVDTSAWSPGHGAFVALGSRPGQIEVCHWIFENDMTWATADE